MPQHSAAFRMNGTNLFSDPHFLRDVRFHVFNENGAAFVIVPSSFVFSEKVHYLNLASRNT